MTAYVIFEADVTDPDQYERYKAHAESSVTAASGRYIARGGTVESFEGDAPTRVVILEFPTFAGASAWYHSDDYTDAKSFRAGAARVRMFLVDGND